MIPQGGLNLMNRRIAWMTFFLFFVFSAPAFAGKDTACQPPYQPTNILKLLLNYSATLEYIIEAPEQCQKPFKRDVTQLVQSTWLFSKGCKDVTFEDFDEAEKKRNEKSAPKQEG
jgi:hypothetical protein